MTGEFPVDSTDADGHVVDPAFDPLAININVDVHPMN